MFQYRVVRKYFIMGLLGLFALCFTGAFTYLDEREVSAWILLTQYSREIQCQYSSPNVYISAFNNWFLLFLPIVAAFPTIPLFCDEYTSRYSLSIVNRIGLRRYVRKTFFAAVFWAVLLVLGALALYGLVVGIAFPIRADMGMVIAAEGLTGELCRAGMFTLAYVLWGGALAGVSYVCAGIGSNIYVNLTLPFLFNYLLRSYLSYGSTEVLTGALVVLVMSYCIAYSIWKYRGRMYGA